MGSGMGLTQELISCLSRVSSRQCLAGSLSGALASAQSKFGWAKPKCSKSINTLKQKYRGCCRNTTGISCIGGSPSKFRFILSLSKDNTEGSLPFNFLETKNANFSLRHKCWQKALLPQPLKRMKKSVLVLGG